MSAPVHYNADPFGPPTCGGFADTGATRLVHSVVSSVTCDLCLVAAFPWLDEFVAKSKARAWGEGFRHAMACGDSPLPNPYGSER